MLRDCNEVGLRMPEDVMQRWRAGGAWTGETLLDRFAATTASRADEVAVTESGTALRYGMVEELSGRIAAALAAMGVRPGHTVAYQLPNWWETVVFAWGALRAGAVLVPITPTLGARETGYILHSTGARVVAVPESFRGVDYPALVASARFDGEVLPVRTPVFDALLARKGVAPTVVVAEDDPAVVLHTSGTTAEPKGVVHTHQSLRHEADSLVAAHGLTRRDRLLQPMPVTHVAGLTYGVLFPFTIGIPAVLMDRWDPGAALGTIERERITYMIGTPVFLRTMVDHPDFAGSDVSRMRLWSMGGAGVSPETVREAARAFPSCWCKRTYGSTELPTLTTALAGDGPDVCALTDGRPIGLAAARIVDPATGIDVADGEAGELWARTPEMLRGYLDSAHDDAAFVDGWFRTGDMAVRSAGCLRIVDRLKDIIIRGGENISAREVEDLLLGHPAVADAAVVAMADRVMGERACAFVTPRPGRRPTLDELTGYLTSTGLARFKLPERLELRAELPRTASGKVHKPSLRAELDVIASPGGAQGPDPEPVSSSP